MKRWVLLVVLGVMSVSVFGQGEIAAESETPDSTFGGWQFVEMTYTIPKTKGLSVTAYTEVDNYWFQRLECVYMRLSIDYKPLKWLSFGFNYVPLYEPRKWKHYVEADVVGTLKSGDFKVSIRERYRYNITSNSHELRSRLKVAYHIPNTRFGVYVAPEVFTWGVDWKKTRHYVAATYNITDYAQLEWYYLYYAFKNSKAEHVIGVGFNFDFTYFNEHHDPLTHDKHHHHSKK